METLLFLSEELFLFTIYTVCETSHNHSSADNKICTTNQYKWQLSFFHYFLFFISSPSCFSPHHLCDTCTWLIVNNMCNHLDSNKCLCFSPQNCANQLDIFIPCDKRWAAYITKKSCNFSIDIQIVLWPFRIMSL